MNIGIGKSFSGIFVASIALVTALAVMGDAPRYGAKGTFRTQDLIVDNNATINGSIVSDNPDVTVGQPLVLTPQLSENIIGTLWNSNDMRTDGNLEVGSAGNFCGGLSGTNNVEAAGSFVFCQGSAGTTPNESLYSFLAHTGSAADSQDITISAAGSNGTIILQGSTDVGSNAGQGGVKIESGGPSAIQVWSVDKQGNTSQPGQAIIGGSMISGGSIEATNGFSDVSGEGYFNSDNTYIKDSGYNCGWSTNAPATCTFNDFGFGDTKSQFRNLAIRDGRGHDIIETYGATTHVGLIGTAQSNTNLSACGGGSPSITNTSTDAQGNITEGTTATGCALAFTGTYGVAPTCICSTTTATAVGCSATATTLTIVNGSASGLVVNYHCFGVIGSS
jgi:hypothetical protein